MMSRLDSAAIKGGAYCWETPTGLGTRTTGLDDTPAASIDHLPWSAGDIRLRFNVIAAAWLQLRVRSSQSHTSGLFCIPLFLSFLSFLCLSRHSLARPYTGLCRCSVSLHIAGVPVRQKAWHPMSPDQALLCIFLCHLFTILHDCVVSSGVEGAVSCVLCLVLRLGEYQIVVHIDFSFPLCPLAHLSHLCSDRLSSHDRRSQQPPFLKDSHPTITNPSLEPSIDAPLFTVKPTVRPHST